MMMTVTMRKDCNRETFWGRGGISERGIIYLDSKIKHTKHGLKKRKERRWIRKYKAEDKLVQSTVYIAMELSQ
jgi:hypothetical protein